MEQIEININPVAKPRMTQRDVWLNPPRPAVAKYWKYKDDLQEVMLKKKLKLPETLHGIFYIPMPKSWSKKKKAEYNLKPHQQTPDSDNLMKAIKDSLCENDSYIWDERSTKYWSYEGMVVLKELK